MAKQDPEVAALQEQLADAQAQIEALQSAAADAEARAATLRERVSQLEEALAAANAELSAHGERHQALQGELDAAQAARDAAQADLAEARAELQEATLKYREARLAAAPHIPADLVAGDTLEEIDQQLESAQRVVSQLREKLQDETRSSRVPVGAPLRRPPNLSGLSAMDKIKLGLQQLAGR